MGQGTYTISAVSETTREYKGQRGDMVVYYVRLEGTKAETPNEAFELHKMATSKPPEKGHTLDVKVFSPGEYQGKPFVKIVQEYKQDGAGGGGGGAKGGYNDPATVARITRSHSQEMALRFLEATGGEHDLDVANMEARGYLNDVLRPLIDWFDADVKQAESPQQPLPQAGSDVPADTDGLQPATAGAAKADDGIPF